MTDTAIRTAAEPDGAPRIAVLDILRGVAILGILFMNINDMGQSFYASFDDIRHLGWSAIDRQAWWAREVLANGTARCLLEMLFGAGLVILTRRAAWTLGDDVVWRRYCRRTLILFGFGLVHIFVLLWPGDILHTYALAALIAFPFRRLRAHRLIPIGLIYAMVMLAGGGASYVADAATRARVTAIEARMAAGTKVSQADRQVLTDESDTRDARADTIARSARDIAAEDIARKGTFLSWAGAQWHTIIDLERNALEILFVWEAASVMLIGMALFRLGILQGARSRRCYAGMMLAGYGLGVPLRILGGLARTALETGQGGAGLHLADAASEVARVAMTLGHVGLVNLLVGSAIGARLLRPFVAAGRTALSIYVAQTLICLWVLYPPFMLGLYGTMTWGPLMLTAFVIDAGLLIGANVWMRHFEIAPVEWAWRSLAGRRRLAWRKTRPVRPDRRADAPLRAPPAPR